MAGVAVLVVCMLAMTVSVSHGASEQDKLRQSQLELLRTLEIQPDELMELNLKTPLVTDGEASAIICHADGPGWTAAAEVIRDAIEEATGVALPMKTGNQITPAEADETNVILLGHLDNNPIAARLYHNFFICMDTGYTREDGYVIRSVHDPFGTGHNYISVGGSHAQGTMNAAERFAEICRDNARTGELTLGRQFLFEGLTGADTADEETVEKQTANIIETMNAPGEGRKGIQDCVGWGVKYHRTGDPGAGQIYRDTLLGWLEHYRTDEYITSEPLSRYDRDFRDAWTHRVGITYDLIEESGLFTDQERLDLTNLVLRLALECALYQNYEGHYDDWVNNDTIVHNHNTFPALGSYFVGNYFKRHYGLDEAQKWIDVANGIFEGQKTASKPLEDAAGYQWLPLQHLIVWSLATGDHTYFEEGHARESARLAISVVDNRGWQAAWGDHSGLMGSSGMGEMLQKIAWYYRDPEILWLTEHVGGSRANLGQPYPCDFEPARPDLERVMTVDLPIQHYEYLDHFPVYPTEPNVAYEDSFDKLALRENWEEGGQYLLLDGYGRGTHMHFDANAIIRFAAGGVPLLVDGEYIKNRPKYHSSMVIIRDGRSVNTPPLVAKENAENLLDCAYTRTAIEDYNGTDWTRNIVWDVGTYLLVADEIRAAEPGEFTLRCCWRPWGDSELTAHGLQTRHEDMRMEILNADGASGRLETLKQAYGQTVSRYSQQVGLKLSPGESYTFLNLIHAEAKDAAEEYSLRRVGPKTVVVHGPGGTDVIAFDEAVSEVTGEGSQARMVLVGSDRLVAAGCTSLVSDIPMFSSTGPVSFEWHPGAGAAVVEAPQDVSCELTVGAGAEITLDGGTVAAAAQDTVSFDLPAGRHHVTMPETQMPQALAEAKSRVANLPQKPADVGGGGVDGPQMQKAWSASGFRAPFEVLDVAEVTATEPYYGRYGPLSKLADGESRSSYNSVMWAPGVEPTITFELADESDISSVTIREWRMSEDWRIERRILQLSSDGFEDDVRTVEDDFEFTGTQEWGTNVNSLYTVEVGQKAKQLRLTLTTPSDDTRVYVADVEIRGTTPGASPEVTALASGDLSGDGKAEIVVASEGGEVRAFTGDGSELWNAQIPSQRPILDLACADVDGDGRDEVIYGGLAARVGLISADGEELWFANPPKYRGIPSDIQTVLAADVTGDGLPEIICGADSWQYFAYDKNGEMLWKNIIYAHSATVGHADDFDGDGKAEIVGGNEYYRANLIDDDGTRIFNYGRFGPEQTAASSADLNGDGTPEVLLGTDDGDLLAFSTKPDLMWTVNLGDRVNRIIPGDFNGDGRVELACAAGSANVYMLAPDGSIIWRTQLPDGVSDMVIGELNGEPVLYAAAGAVGVIGLDYSGNVICVGKTQDRVRQVQTAAGCIAATTDGGEVSGFSVE